MLKTFAYFLAVFALFKSTEAGGAFTFQIRLRRPSSSSSAPSTTSSSTSVAMTSSSTTIGLPTTSASPISVSPPATTTTSAAPTSISSSTPLTTSSSSSSKAMTSTSTSPSASPLPTGGGSSGSLFSWPSGKKLIVYFAQWGIYGRNYQVADLPIDQISDINYAFFDLPQSFVPTSLDSWADFDKRYTSSGVPPLDNWNTNDGVYGNFGQFLKLKKLGKKFNFGISIGGWTKSRYFSTAVATEESRRTFINGLIDLVKKYPELIDRIDLDWEYPSNDGKNYGDSGNLVNKDDSNNFGIFLGQLRNALNAAGLQRIELSSCAIARPDVIEQLPLAQMSQYLDTINIMTYDFASSAWGAGPATHQTNLYPVSHSPYSIKGAVDAFLKNGVPANKLVIGAAYYSRGFANTDGLGQPSSGVVSDMSWEPGVCDYKTLPRPGATEYWDDQAKATYSYDPVKKILNSYDSVQSVTEKAKYIWDMGLKGIIVWEASGDFPIDNSRSLTAALYKGLTSRP